MLLVVLRMLALMMAGADDDNHTDTYRNDDDDDNDDHDDDDDADGDNEDDDDGGNADGGNNRDGEDVSDVPLFIFQLLALLSTYWGRFGLKLSFCCYSCYILDFCNTLCIFLSGFLVLKICMHCT